MTAPASPAAVYRMSADAVLTAQATDSQLGLSAEEARARLERYGRNELEGDRPTPTWRKFLEQFNDVLVILLLIATAVSASLWLLERDAALPYEAIAIFAVVLLNAVMGYVQQARAENAVAALRQMSAAKANVVRGGVRQSIPAAEVVPGDIIAVEEGDTVPAFHRTLLACSCAVKPRRQSTEATGAWLRAQLRRHRRSISTAC